MDVRAEPAHMPRRGDKTRALPHPHRVERPEVSIGGFEHHPIVWLTTTIHAGEHQWWCSSAPLALPVTDSAVAKVKEPYLRGNFPAPPGALGRDLGFLEVRLRGSSLRRRACFAIKCVDPVYHVLPLLAKS